MRALGSGVLWTKQYQARDVDHLVLTVIYSCLIISLGQDELSGRWARLLCSFFGEEEGVTAPAMLQSHLQDLFPAFTFSCTESATAYEYEHCRNRDCDGERHQDPIYVSMAFFLLAVYSTWKRAKMVLRPGTELRRGLCAAVAGHTS